jgi:hypothetical protein
MRAKRPYRNTTSTIHRLREKNGLCILLRQVPLTQDNGSAVSVMVQVYKFGQMAQDMRVSGRIIELMGMENSFMWTETFTRVIGSMTKPTDTEFTFM